jgi:hypothetical protein
VNEEHGARAALLEGRAKVVRSRRLPPGVGERDDVAAERPAHCLPALAELALRDGEDALARREDVDDRRLERAGSRRREDEHLVLRTEHRPESLLREREDLGEVGRAVMEHRSGERGEHLGRHRGGAGRQELLRARHRSEPSEAWVRRGNDGVGTARPLIVAALSDASRT